MALAQRGRKVSDDNRVFSADCASSKSPWMPITFRLAASSVTICRRCTSDVPPSGVQAATLTLARSLNVSRSPARYHRWSPQDQVLLAARLARLDRIAGAAGPCPRRPAWPMVQLGDEQVVRAPVHGHRMRRVVENHRTARERGRSPPVDVQFRTHRAPRAPASCNRCPGGHAERLAQLGQAFRHIDAAERRHRAENGLENVTDDGRLPSLPRVSMKFMVRCGSTKADYNLWRRGGPPGAPGSRPGSRTTGVSCATSAGPSARASVYQTPLPGWTCNLAVLAAGPHALLEFGERLQPGPGIGAYHRPARRSVDDQFIVATHPQASARDPRASVAIPGQPGRRAPPRRQAATATEPQAAHVRRPCGTRVRG